MEADHDGGEGEGEEEEADGEEQERNMRNPAGRKAANMVKAIERLQARSARGGTRGVRTNRSMIR